MALKKIVVFLGTFAIANSVNCAQANANLYTSPVTHEDIARADFQNCPICQDGEIDGVQWQLCKSNCQSEVPHIFHKTCIERWRNSGNAGAHLCPVCRQRMVDRRGIVELNWFESIENGDINEIRLLIANDINLDMRDGVGRTALMLASISGRTDIVRLLIENNADLNIRGNRGETVLMLASISGHENAVRLLIENGVDLNMQDNDGQTALMKARNMGHENIVRLLMMHELPQVLE